MTIETWADIPDAEIDVGATIRIEGLDQLRKNVMLLREHTFRLRLDPEVSTSPPAADTWAKIFDFDGIWIPGWGQRIVFGLAGKVDAGTGRLRFRVGTDDSDESAAFTNTAYDATVSICDISGTPITSRRRTKPTVQLWAKNSGVNKTYGREYRLIGGTALHNGSAVSRFDQAS